MKAGIVGLPNVGKSTLFNALTSSKQAQAANYPFCTIEPNEGIVPVPDSRLARITKFIPPQKVIPSALTLVDIAGIVKGAGWLAEPRRPATHVRARIWLVRPMMACPAALFAACHAA